MRPRGLSSSSPRRTKVGQVAVQKPQWTHLRITASEAAVSGSASRAALKLVCMHAVSVDRLQETAGLEDALGIEGAAHPRFQGGDAGGLGMQRGRRAAQRLVATDQHGVAAGGGG